MESSNLRNPDRRNDELMPTPIKETPEQTAMRKAGLLSAVAQLNLLIGAFGTAPDRVVKAAKEFKESLVEWANA